MRRFIILRIVLASLVSGCAVTDQASIEFRTSNDLTFELSKSRFDAIEVQPFETQLWLDSAIVGSLRTMETSQDFETAVDEVRQGSNETQQYSGKVKKLDLGGSAYGFSVTVKGYTTAFIATSEHPSSWITISTQDDVFGEVLSSLSVSKTRE